MNKLSFFMATFFVFTITAGAQLEIPTSKGVYGGRLNWIESIPVPGDYDGDGKTDLAGYIPVGGKR